MNIRVLRTIFISALTAAAFGQSTSAPPFTTADTAALYHNTFDPFYRSAEGAVPENTAMTLRFRTLQATQQIGRAHV